MQFVGCRIQDLISHADVRCRTRMQSWDLKTECRIEDEGHGLQDAGCKNEMPGMGYRLQDMECRT